MEIQRYNQNRMDIIKQRKFLKLTQDKYDEYNSGTYVERRLLRQVVYENTISKVSRILEKLLARKKELRVRLHFI